MIIDCKLRNYGGQLSSAFLRTLRLTVNKQIGTGDETNFMMVNLLLRFQFEEDTCLKKTLTVFVHQPHSAILSLSLSAKSRLAYVL